MNENLEMADACFDKPMAMLIAWQTISTVRRPGVVRHQPHAQATGKP